MCEVEISILVVVQEVMVMVIAKMVKAKLGEIFSPFYGHIILQTLLTLAQMSQVGVVPLPCMKISTRCIILDGPLIIKILPKYLVVITELVIDLVFFFLL